jgi:hypothetical protein
MDDYPLIANHGLKRGPGSDGLKDQSEVGRWSR